MPDRLRDFLIVLVGASSVLGVVYIGLTLTFGQPWISSNATMIFVNGLYWLLIPPFIWMVRYRPEEKRGFLSPKVRIILDDGNLITEPCNWMAYRTAVSVFKFQDEVEQFICLAYVVNIQSNGLIQLQPIASRNGKYEVSKLREIREKLLVKPGHLHE